MAKNDDDTPEPTDPLNESREGAGDIKLRKSITHLSEEELAALRAAFSAAMEVRDSRGYGHFASLHGLPDPGLCEHGNELFLPWHRAYLYYFEQALQDLVPGVTLPWWDWTESRDLPAAFTEEQDASGAPNPLVDAPIVMAGGLRDEAWPERTWRAPGAHPRYPDLPTSGWVQHVLEGVNYEDFWQRIEQIHNGVHMWTGGTMSSQRYAGWDPIFWAHHTMVDRLWALWQLAHPGDNPRRRLLWNGLNYFKDMTVRDTLDFSDLGYDYAVAEVLVHTGGV